jgi:hypothetical protein
MSYANYVNVSVLVNGRPVREYTHKGLTLIESRHGTNYTVKIKNDNSFKVMAVLSIDGLDVLTGKPADDSKKGYIVDSYSSTEIKGYRLSDNDSASFIFTKKNKSYVTQTTGEKRNTGVIGVRIFKEKEEPIKIVEKTVYVDRPYYVHPQPYWVNPWNPWGLNGNVYYGAILTTTGGYSTSGTSGVSCGANSITLNNASIDNGITLCGGSVDNLNVASSNCGLNNLMNAGGAAYCCSGDTTRGVIGSAVQSSNSFDAPPITTDSFDSGTAWGKKQLDKVKKEYFKVGEILTEIIFYYATKDALIAMGVDLDESPKVADALPSAFGDYCKPPTGWRG